MATKTRAELVAAALANLGALSAGQSPSDEDASTVDAHVDTVLASLSSKGVVTINDDEAIPEEVFGGIADWLTEKAAPNYGRPTSPQAQLHAEVEIRKAIYGRPTREPLTVDYF